MQDDILTKLCNFFILQIERTLQNNRKRGLDRSISANEKTELSSEILI